MLITDEMDDDDDENGEIDKNDDDDDDDDTTKTKIETVLYTVSIPLCYVTPPFIKLTWFSIRKEYPMPR